MAFSEIPIEIIKIYDGDTVIAKLENGNVFPIRLIDIDCFEAQVIDRAYKQSYYKKLSIENILEKGMQSKFYLISLLENSKKISFDFMGIDKYKRALGILYFDGININKKMLDEKICEPYTYAATKNNYSEKTILE